ncbi:MAG: metallophosphoesterase [Myxococcota bacterium]|nr:metallophosphoesterase [Myxococcota bacterium]
MALARPVSSWFHTVVCGLAFFFCAEVAAQTTPVEVFFVYGDNRSGHDVHRSIVKEIAGTTHTAVLNTGDLVSYGWAPWQWHTFLEIIKPINDSTTEPPVYLAALGNHDVIWERLAYPRWHKSLPWLPGNGEYYSYDTRYVRFIVLDSNPRNLGTKQTNALLGWLKSNPKPWTVVIWHHPSYPFGGKEVHGESKNKWWPLLHKYGVDIVFNGHAHNYSRSYPINPIPGSPYGIRDDKDGVVQIIAGGGGARLYPTAKDENNAPYFDTLLAATVDKQHTYCRLSVTDTSLTLTAQTLDGQKVDTLELTSNKPKKIIR